MFFRVGKGHGNLLDGPAVKTANARDGDGQFYLLAESDRKHLENPWRLAEPNHPMAAAVRTVHGVGINRHMQDGGAVKKTVLRYST